MHAIYWKLVKSEHIIFLTFLLKKDTSGKYLIGSHSFSVIV